MKNYNEAVDKLFSEKENLIILGLTGRTGAGCSTASDILKKKYDDLEFEYVTHGDNSPADNYKFEIIKEYIGKEGRWVPFTRIEGSCVILSYIFENEGIEGNSSEALIEYLVSLQAAKTDIAFKIDNFSDLVSELQGLGYIFDEVQEKPLSDVDANWKNMNDDDIKSYYELYIEKMPQYKERLKKILLKYSCYEEKKKKIQDEPPVKFHLYTYLFQKIGNNIRASGNPYDDTFSQNKIFSFAERLEKLINLIVMHDKLSKKFKSRICIDAIRNANESNYLKDKYRSYFLLSISVDEDTRRKRLSNLDIDEQNSLDSVEYKSKLEPAEFFYHQNLANCFEMADIHLVNEEENGKKLYLTWQLVKYITLMIHPGLITPTAMERCMQLAYNAKYNSGCLSRQVGAVVTGADYAVKSVGWNEVPKDQLSCSLRNIEGYCKGNMQECYSQYEHEDPAFRKVMERLNDSIKKTDMHGRKFSYCFKDVYNGYIDEKNQVYTRALHAEENAFLQISKYGGQGIKDGYLFCTASPCELCAKKAYQLGIKNIYYIDPYPGISEKHILSFGKKQDSNPKMNLFSGAIGEAYIKLYKPLLPYKDELELVSGVNCKVEAKKIKEGTKEVLQPKDLLYHSIEFTIEFKNRENIESYRKVNIEIKNGTFLKLERQLTWTGSSYDKSELIENDEGYILNDSKDKVSPYKYEIVLNKKAKPTDKIKYHIKSYVKDETHLMHPYFAQMIKYPTEFLRLRVIIPKASPLIENVRYTRYADLKMECEYTDTEQKIQEKVEGENIVYTLEIHKPNLFYTYSIEWDFINVKT